MPASAWIKYLRTISEFKNQKLNFYYTVPLSQRINQIFEILELYCFAFTASAIDKLLQNATFYSARLKLS